MADIIFKEESYKIVGACIAVHKELGMGFKEAVYKDALELEFNASEIPFRREKAYIIQVQGKDLTEKILCRFRSL